MVSAVCPNCHILLVEANSAAFSDLGTAVNEAVALGANVVSNSYGGAEWSTENQTNVADYDHPGVAITAAAGDGGYGAEFPAASNFVTAVGGTTLLQATDTGTRDATETVWTGTGSGCSAHEPEAGVANRRRAARCAPSPTSRRWPTRARASGSMTPTAAATWAVFGGTSVATPIVGAVYALADNAAGSATAMNSLPYADPEALNDVTTGTNGSCTPAYLCTGEAGYDGPTGLGTPNATEAFTAVAAAPNKPTAPISLVAVAGNASVRLSWSPPSSNGGSALTGYNVYRGLSPKGETLMASRVATPSYLDTSVTDATRYYYEVTAVNGVGEGPPSLEVSATPQASVPGPPRSLSAKPATSKGVTLAWTAPASNGGAPIVGYRLSRGTRSRRESSYLTVTCTGTTCSYTDTGAQSGTTYYYDVAATNSVGTGSVSNEASAKAR